MSSRWDDSVFALAERLHMPVYAIKRDMPLDEFLGWMRYINGGSAGNEVDGATADPSAIAAMF